MRSVYRALFNVACIVGRPFGGIRPGRIYTILGRRAFTKPEFEWHKIKWGYELLLSPYYDMDRLILALGAYDPNLHALIERYVQPQMVCFDIGANLGDMALHMARRVRPGGRIFAFEPVPPIFQRLKTNIEHNSMADTVIPIEAALSDLCGTAEIYSPDAGQRNQGIGSLVHASAEVADRYQVRTTTLDEFVAEHQLSRVDVLKIDIQGGEIRMLTGGDQTLRRFSPDLFIEVWSDDLRAAGYNSRDLCQLIAGHGYRLFAVKNGKPAKEIDALTVSPNFRASNIFCTKRMAL
jgi:FkbM family methyltransferase